MSVIKIVLDTRRKGETHPLCLSVAHKGKTALKRLGISVSAEQWEDGRVKKHPRAAAYNHTIMRILLEVNERFAALQERRASMTAEELRDAILGIEKETAPIHTVATWAEKVMSTKVGSRKATFQTMINHLRSYDPDLDKRDLREVKAEWLEGFLHHLEQIGLSANSRYLFLTVVKCIFNAALDAEIIDRNPFRKVRLKQTPTRKRSLPPHELRAIFCHPVKKKKEKRVLDLFKLSFLLIDINYQDLFAPTTTMRRGRLEYLRAKTKRAYSVKIVPEALEIIKRYKGESEGIVSTQKSVNVETQRAGKLLKKIGAELGIEDAHLLSTYWARHSWATIASSLDIPRDVIAHALGHGTNTITDIYIDFDEKKVDEANRKVIDKVLYDKG